MGLDNYFVLNKSDEKDIVLGHFRNFHELDNFIQTKTGNRLNHKDIIPIDSLILKSLLEELKPIIRLLSKYSINEIMYFDEYGYPKDLCRKSYNNTFSLGEEITSFKGNKIITLYNIIISMLELLELNNDNFEWKILFISSD